MSEASHGTAPRSSSASASIGSLWPSSPPSQSSACSLTISPARLGRHQGRFPFPALVYPVYFWNIIYNLEQSYLRISLCKWKYVLLLGSSNIKLFQRLHRLQARTHHHHCPCPWHDCQLMYRFSRLQFHVPSSCLSNSTGALENPKHSKSWHFWIICLFLTLATK